ncbi:hypothetical protein GOP47_0025914 [Adiantum capillus-veneris]|uniref:Uncharacterized protein n=1 Tax=Adiantum capillus-veneris TaxID=13818 RepID=A0A9D4U279_ADICA|nr:hypothetical protein GOP47_0025914 [Adiantum capillus-veneris]
MRKSRGYASRPLGSFLLPIRELNHTFWYLLQVQTHGKVVQHIFGRLGVALRSNWIVWQSLFMLQPS